MDGEVAVEDVAILVRLWAVPSCGDPPFLWWAGHFLCESNSAGTGSGEGQMSANRRQSKYRDLEILFQAPRVFRGALLPEGFLFLLP